MSTVIWFEIAHHAAFRVGGWAFVRQDAVGITGAAGGARQTTAQQALFTGLIAALKDAPAGATLRTSHALPVEPPEDDPALWTALQTALAAKKVQVVRSPQNKFAYAWAELARDKAKAKGPFTSAIPKPNLAKFTAA